MKIAIAQLNFHIGNFEGNLSKMLQAVETAKTQGADLVCFSELATVGYPPRDFLEFEAFVRALVVLLLAIKILHLSMGPAPGTRKMADAAGPSSKNPRETTKSTIRGRSRFSRCERRPEAAFDKQHIAHRVITHENNKAFHRKTNQAG